MEQAEKRVQYYEGKALQLVMAYLSFQGVILVSIASKLSAFSCRHWWLPFSLSFLSALIFGLNFADTLINYLAARSRYNELCSSHLQLLQTVETWPTALNSNLVEIQINEPDDVTGIKTSNLISTISAPVDSGAEYKHYVFIFVTLLSLVALTIIMLLACRSILCDGGTSP